MTSGFKKGIILKYFRVSVKFNLSNIHEIIKIEFLSLK